MSEAKATQLHCAVGIDGCRASWVTGIRELDTLNDPRIRESHPELVFSAFESERVLYLFGKCLIDLIDR